MKANAVVMVVAAVLAVGIGAGAYRLGLDHAAHGNGQPPVVGASGGSTDSGSAPASGVQTADAQKAGVPDAGNGRRVLYWHDPMVPNTRFDKPGKSPFMDMQLVPVYADAGGGSGDAAGVAIASRVQQNLGMRTAEVTQGSLARPLEVSGAIAWNERDVAVVAARTGGFVERLYVRAALDAVTRGQQLAEIYAPEWVSVQEEYLAVRRMQGTGTAPIVDGARQRMLLAGMSEEQVRAVEAAGAVQARFTMRAPIAGVIAELGVREGMTLMPGAMMFRINGLGSVWVNAEVPEARADALRTGMSARARTPSLPERVFQGRVAAVLPEVNPVTRTLKARIELANPGAALVPGMFATVELLPTARAPSLLVPSEAVIPTGERKVVIVALEGGRFQPVDVQTGEEAMGQTEIRKGLSAGQKVVVSGQFLIDSEASLKASTTRMTDVPEVSKAKGTPAVAAPLHRAEGVVVDIDAASALIKHGAIATAGMGAMTMEFKAPAAGMPAGVRKGDRVRFAFAITGAGEFVLSSIEAAK